MYTSTVRLKLIEISLRIFLQKRYFLQNSKIGSLIDNLTDQKLILNNLYAVPYNEFNERYNQRDSIARENMRKLVDSEANKVTNVFSTLI